MPDFPHNRKRERLVFRDVDRLFSVQLHWSSHTQTIDSQSVLDVNGQGIALGVEGGSPIQPLSTIEALSFFWRGKKIGSRSVEGAYLEKSPGQSTRDHSRLRIIYRPPYPRYYLPPDALERIRRNVYRVKPEVSRTLDARFIRTVVGSGFDYKDRRVRDRLRLSLEDAISAEPCVSGAPRRRLPVVDLSSKGLSLLVTESDHLDYWLSGIEALSLYVRDDLIHRKRVKRYIIVPGDVRGMRAAKISAVFDSDVKATFHEHDPLFSREGHSVRLREKTLYPNIIAALISDTDDVQFAVTDDVSVKERIFSLRYEAYSDEGKIHPKDFPDGRMVDKFDNGAVHVFGHVHGLVVAAARIVPDDRFDVFEFEESVDLPSFRKKGLRYAEVSRFCVDRFFRNDVNKNLSLTLRLIGEVCRVGWASGIDAFLITAYKPHVKLYQAIGFKVVSDFVKLRGFNYEYAIMEWDLDPRKTALSYRRHLSQIRAQVSRSESKKDQQ